MTDHTPFAIRMLAEVGRLAAWTTRGFLAAIGTDPAAAMAFGVLVLVVTLSLPLALRTLIVGERWIARRLTAHRDRAAFEAIAEHFDDTADEPTQHLDEVVRIQPRPAPALRRNVHRRLRRFPRRPMRRHTNTSNSDRRH